ncbi:MAG TPA: cytochrome oxidase small assembly protein [Burkholderiales bacterium]|nr:cytochrome oxidase small assembly protein [Burkholderiales bacterium]
MSRNARTGLIIATIALMFFLGIIARYWLLGR